MPRGRGPVRLHVWKVSPRGFAWVVSGLLAAHHRLRFAAVRAVFAPPDFPPSPIVRIMVSLIAIRLGRPRAIDVMSLRAAGSA